MPDELQAWPYREARSILDSATSSGSDDDPVVLETGFGPSGLPHAGTFAEVARTTWVRRALEDLCDRETELIVFSDDMDGLRDVPENVPQGDMLFEHLGRPLCDVPDPHGESESFADYMHAELERFLDSFEFDYRFVSSREQYRSGTFDEGLERLVDRRQKVREVIVPTLREWRQSRWSAFFPICESCGKLYTTSVEEVDAETYEIAYTCSREPKGMTSCGHEGRRSVTGGGVKVGWKIDWALRWFAFDVDYEMYGKDLIESAELSSEIVDILGGEPPAGFFYEMFLDADGSKISKSVGTGLTIDQWLDYAPLEALAWFIFQNPQKAKKFHAGIVPDTVDSWLDDRRAFGAADSDRSRRENPIWFVERDRLEADEEIGLDSDVDYSALLNLVGALNTDDREMIWTYVLDYDPAADEDRELIDALLDGVLAFYRDRVLPEKEYRPPPSELRPAVDQFRDFLDDYGGQDAETIQNRAYEIGKASEAPLGEWFSAMYRLILGQDHGPRLGSLVDVFGVDATVEAIDERLE